MLDQGYGQGTNFREPTFLRGWVNNANPSIRIHLNPKGLRNGRKSGRSLPIAGTHSHRSEIGESSPKACEFLLKQRIVLHTLLLAFQPLHVAL